MLGQIVRPSGAMAGFLGQYNFHMLYRTHCFRNMGGKMLQRRAGAMRLGSSRAKGVMVGNRRNPAGLARPGEVPVATQFSKARPNLE
jgi:hypothetical protein